MCVNKKKKSGTKTHAKGSKVDKCNNNISLKHDIYDEHLTGELE